MIGAATVGAAASGVAAVAIGSAQALLAARVLGRFRDSAGGASVRATSQPCAARICVLLPVLDEEGRVDACLAGITAMGEEVARILVVDGGSRDATAARVAAHARRDPRVRLVDASPMPSGWTGKAWGLHVGLGHTQGTDWVLCLDADVSADPRLPRSLVHHAAQVGVCALSIATRQRLTGALQGLVHPALLATLVYRFGSPGHATCDPRRVQVNGQCFLARRDVLLATRAFEAARSSLCEDVTIGRHLAASGVAVGFYEAGGLAEAAMYDSAAEAWRNWPRSLPLRDAFFGASGLLDLASVLLVQALPLPLLVLVLLWGAPAWLASLEAFLVVMRIGVLFGMARAYAPRPWSYWLSPLLDVPVAWRLIRSAAQRRHAWRGRIYLRSRSGGFRAVGGSG